MAIKSFDIILEEEIAEKVENAAKKSECSVDEYFRRLAERDLEQRKIQKL